MQRKFVSRALQLITKDELIQPVSYTLGYELWHRFTGSKEETIWYYRTLVDAFRTAGDLEDMVEELDEVVGDIEELQA